MYLESQMFMVFFLIPLLYMLLSWSVFFFLLNVLIQFIYFFNYQAAIWFHYQLWLSVFTLELFTRFFCSLVCVLFIFSLANVSSVCRDENNNCLSVLSVNQSVHCAHAQPPTQLSYSIRISMDILCSPLVHTLTLPNTVIWFDFFVLVCILYLYVFCILLCALQWVVSSINCLLSSFCQWSNCGLSRHWMKR